MKKYNYLIAYHCYMSGFGWTGDTNQKTDSTLISCDHKLNTLKGITEVEKMIHKSVWSEYKSGWQDMTKLNANYDYSKDLIVKILSITELEN